MARQRAVIISRLVICLLPLWLQSQAVVSHHHSSGGSEISKAAIMMRISSIISMITAMLCFLQHGTSQKQQTSAYSNIKEIDANVDNTVHRQLSSANCRWETTSASNPPIYWINLAANTARKQYMESQLAAFRFHKQQRIEAVTPNSTTYKLLKLLKPCKRNTDRDIAVIMSHLTAIHIAIYDTTSNGLNSEYALIVEDDVKLLFHLNFTALIASAPRDFGILQLVTSNEEAIQGLWATYKQQTNDVTSDWTKRLWTRNLWYVYPFPELSHDYVTVT